MQTLHTSLRPCMSVIHGDFTDTVTLEISKNHNTDLNLRLKNVIFSKVIQRSAAWKQKSKKLTIPYQFFFAQRASLIGQDAIVFDGMDAAKQTFFSNQLLMFRQKTPFVSDPKDQHFLKFYFKSFFAENVTLKF